MEKIILTKNLKEKMTDLNTSGEHKVYGELSTSFINAIREGDKALKEIEEHLDHGGMNVNADDGWPLITACLLGHVETVKLLLRRGANVHVRNNEAVILAGKRGDVKIMQLLLASMNFKNSKEEKIRVREEQTTSTPLTPPTPLALSTPLTPLTPSTPSTSPTLLALSTPSAPPVRLLLEQKVNTKNVGAQENFIQVALSNAIENKDIETTKLLLECGVVDDQSANALIKDAIVRDDLFLTKFLLKLGARPQGTEGSAAYHPRLLMSKPTVTERFIKSWSTYTQADKYFSLQEVKKKVEVDGDKNLINILEGFGADVEERIITIYLSGINLTKQEGFGKYKKSLEGYKKTVTENLSKYFNLDVINLVIFYI